MAEWMIQEQFENFVQMRAALARAMDAVHEREALNEETFFDLRLILWELCCNALEHGASPVEVTISMCRCEGRHIHALITDVGEGFDPCFQSLNVEQERGRGLVIVNSLAQGLAYNAAANKVLVRLNV